MAKVCSNICAAIRSTDFESRATSSDRATAEAGGCVAENSDAGKRKNLGTFDSREAAEKHERAVQYFKRAG